jgi:hypothetical protein
MIDIIYTDPLIPQGVFYPQNNLKFGYTLNLADFVRKHFEHRIVKSPEYVNDTYLFLAVAQPDGLFQFVLNIHKFIIKVPDSEKLTIVVSYPMETFIDHNVNTLFKQLKDVYKKAKFFFSYGNAINSSEYIKTLLGDNVEYIPNPLFEMQYGDHIRNSSLTNYEEKPLNKKFLIPIRQAKPFRLFFYLWAKDNGILENSYYSWTTENVYAAIKQLKENSPLVRELSSHDSELLKTPVILDSEDYRTVQQKQWDMPQDKVSSSFMQIVCETTFYEGLEKGNPTIFLTEKTYKPIFYKQPFILVSEPRSLLNLRNLGYKTFSSFIDESYDLINDPNSRMKSICKEVEKINSMSLQQLEQIRAEINEIVEHNYNVFMSKPSESVLLKHIEEILFHGKKVNHTNIRG